MFTSIASFFILKSSLTCYSLSKLFNKAAVAAEAAAVAVAAAAPAAAAATKLFNLYTYPL